MFTVVNEGLQITVPGWVSDLEAFRRWTESEDFPDDVRVWWLKGKVWIDMSKEQIFTHVLIKTKITMTLAQLVEQEQLGLYFTDGILMSSFAADVSGNPDGLFLSTATLGSDRVRFIEGREGGFTELQGTAGHGPGNRQQEFREKGQRRPSPRLLGGGGFRILDR